MVADDDAIIPYQKSEGMGLCLPIHQQSRLPQSRACEKQWHWATKAARTANDWRFVRATTFEDAS